METCLLQRGSTFAVRRFPQNNFKWPQSIAGKAASHVGSAIAIESVRRQDNTGVHARGERHELRGRIQPIAAIGKAPCPNLKGEGNFYDNGTRSEETRLLARNHFYQHSFIPFARKPFTKGGSFCEHSQYFYNSSKYDVRHAADGSEMRQLN